MHCLQRYETRDLDKSTGDPWISDPREMEIEAKPEVLVVDHFAM